MIFLKLWLSKMRKFNRIGETFFQSLSEKVVSVHVIKPLPIAAAYRLLKGILMLVWISLGVRLMDQRSNLHSVLAKPFSIKNLDKNMKSNFILLLVSLVSFSSNAQSVSEQLSSLNANARAWVESSCLRFFGPSLYSSCVQREVRAIKGL